MPNRLQFAFLLALLCSAAPAWAQQSEYYRVHLLSGPVIPGKLGSITKDAVTLATLPNPKEFPVNEIRYVQLPSEPRELTEARNLAFDGHYDQSLQMLDKIPPPQLANEVVKQDADFYRSFDNAKLAIAGVGDPRSAGTALIAYLKNNKDSYHYYDANEAAGDLLVAMGRYDQAPNYYKELATAPWPDFKMRAAAAQAKALAAQGKHEEAIKQFDAALAQDAKGKTAEVQAMAARIGKARSMAELGRGKEAIDMLNDALDKAPAENNLIHAQAYNALGATYLKLKQPKDALYAYLHTDLIYNQSPSEHAEALHFLKDLWTQDKKPDRAKEAADTLKQRYPTSLWNK
ncbi:MAG TPA: tetratricopeptide repeat protein [Pirellulales bacterium]|jgi:tetratricopeptide (TPR) repeat protein